MAVGAIPSQPLSEATAGSAEARIKIRELEGTVDKTLTGVMCALNMLLDLKDLRTGLHATRLAEWAVRVGERLGVSGSELRDLERAAVVHDIGKIGVPDEVLLKPEKLTAEEFGYAARHPEYGWAILQSIPGFEKASLLVLHHHERYDGKGYPAGLEGEEIPLGSRIVAVVDAYDAMVSDRTYRKGLPHEEAARRLEADTGTQFDPVVTPLFLSMLDQEEWPRQERDDEREPLILGPILD